MPARLSGSQGTGGRHFSSHPPRYRRLAAAAAFVTYSAGHNSARPEGGVEAGAGATHPRAMGRPLYLDVIERPCTSLVIAVCTSLWYYLHHSGLGYDEVGMSYSKVIGQRQYWRCITATFSHVSLLHLLFNMSSLWQGLKVVHFSAQRKHFLWDMMGTFSRYVGHASSQTEHKMVHWPERLRLS